MRRAAPVVAAALLAAACASGARGPAVAGPPPMTLTVYAAMGDGGPHWFPAALSVPAGTPLTLVIVNTLGRPHRFAIAGTNISEEVPAGGARAVFVELDTPGSYPYFDPDDSRVVGGVLTVTPADAGAQP